MTPSAREVPIVVSRSARYYVAGGDEGGRAPAELWIVLHGYGQLAARFVRVFACIAGPDRVVVAPEALNRFYLPTADGTRNHSAAKVGATWMTREDRQREIADQRGYLDAVLGDVLARWPGATRPRLVVLGFSQGVATAMRWAAHDGVGADRIVAWSGTLPAELEAPTVARHFAGRTTVVLGRADELLTREGVDAELARLRSIGLEPELLWHDGGHAIDEATLRRLL